MPTSRKINTIQTEQSCNMKSKNGTADRQTQPSSEQIKLYSERHYSNDFKNQILLYKIGVIHLRSFTDTTQIYKNNRTAELYETSTQYTVREPHQA